jgi:hypothetical protein
MTPDPERYVKQTRREQGFWPTVIVKALRHWGGEADLGDIGDWIERNVALTPHELGDSG